MSIWSYRSGILEWWNNGSMEYWGNPGRKIEETDELFG